MHKKPVCFATRQGSALEALGTYPRVLLWFESSVNSAFEGDSSSRAVGVDAEYMLGRNFQ